MSNRPPFTTQHQESHQLPLLFAGQFLVDMHNILLLDQESTDCLCVAVDRYSFLAFGSFGRSASTIFCWRGVSTSRCAPGSMRAATRHL